MKFPRILDWFFCTKSFSRGAAVLVLAVGGSAAAAVTTNWWNPEGPNVPLTVWVKPDGSRLEIRHRGNPILIYACASNQYKPYVKELHTLRGEDVLRDAPADHLHHHGLMYAITVNGLNFWEESPRAGLQVPVALIPAKLGVDDAGLPRATFTQVIHWVAPTDRRWAESESVALLVERRTLTLTLDVPKDEVAVRWQSDFTVGRADTVVRLSGTRYHGLGMRFPQEFDKAAKYENSEKAAYSEGHKNDVTAARWSAVSQVVNTRDLLVALFASPANAGEGRFFSMVDPFAYLSATQGLDQKPIQARTGDQFSLDYLVTVYSAKKASEFLEERDERWLKSMPRE